MPCIQLISAIYNENIINAISNLLLLLMLLLTLLLMLHAAERSVQRCIKKGNELDYWTAWCVRVCVCVCVGDKEISHIR